MPVDLVLNAHRFVEDVIAGVAEELSDQVVENQLYDAIKVGDYHILITERASGASIRGEYEKEAVDQGLGPQLVLTLDQLKSRGIVETPNLPRRSIPNLPGHHKIFIQDAVTAEVRYFVTENQQWLELDRHKQICPKLRIMNVRQFLRVARRSSR